MLIWKVKWILDLIFADLVKGYMRSEFLRY
nr:MAG TPA: hypothetical protein [Caudoviricetes sp.]